MPIQCPVPKIPSINIEKSVNSSIYSVLIRLAGFLFKSCARHLHTLVGLPESIGISAGVAFRAVSGSGLKFSTAFNQEFAPEASIREVAPLS